MIKGHILHYANNVQQIGVLIHIFIRELIKVCQKNLKKYMGLRDWGWFIAIQKTRPLIGRADPNEELRILEEKAASTYGQYKEKLDTKEKLLKENNNIVEEKKALMTQIDKEQGNMSQYTERQERANAEKGRLEAELARAQDLLVKTENARVQANLDKVKKEIYFYDGPFRFRFLFNISTRPLISQEDYFQHLIIWFLFISVFFVCRNPLRMRLGT